MEEHKNAFESTDKTAKILVSELVDLHTQKAKFMKLVTSLGGKNKLSWKERRVFDKAMRKLEKLDGAISIKNGDIEIHQVALIKAKTIESSFTNIHSNFSEDPSAEDLRRQEKKFQKFVAKTTRAVDLPVFVSEYSSLE